MNTHCICFCGEITKISVDNQSYLKLCIKLNSFLTWVIFTLHAALRSLCLLLTRNSAVISRGGFTSEASFHCLCNSATLSLRARH